MSRAGNCEVSCAIHNVPSLFVSNLASDWKLQIHTQHFEKHNLCGKVAEQIRRSFTLSLAR